MINKKYILHEYYDYYELKPNLKIGIKNSPKDKTVTHNTIEVFNQFHEHKYASIFYQLKNPFYKLRQYEKVVFFENRKIFFHTYYVLFLIYRYLESIDFYNSDEYENSFAGLKSDKVKFRKKYRKFRKEIFDMCNTFPGSSKIYAVLFRMMIHNRPFTEIFLNIYTLIPIEQIKFKEDETWMKSIIKKIYLYFSSTPIHSEEIIYKSLAIVLNAYFRQKMQIKSSYALNIVNEILYILFGYYIKENSADLLRKIYISGRLGGLPIFKNKTSNKIYPDSVIEQYDDFFKELKKELPEISFISMDAERFFNEHPINMFFQLFPSEFLHPVK
ncbi:hypothetical protein [Nitrosophilus alvini]|uniref:hypothetical protein n=1 Tax=Nitrosophilus alvini TaxID=2714855 RepID=UPI00190DEAAE|nr:hypothetical protein [Nitrosophilus alvini]